jgi:hypothetical protein
MCSLPCFAWTGPGDCRRGGSPGGHLVRDQVDFFPRACQSHALLDQGDEEAMPSLGTAQILCSVSAAALDPLVSNVSTLLAVRCPLARSCNFY